MKTDINLTFIKSLDPKVEGTLYYISSTNENGGSKRLGSIMFLKQDDEVVADLSCSRVSTLELKEIQGFMDELNKKIRILPENLICRIDELMLHIDDNYNKSTLVDLLNDIKCRLQSVGNDDI